MKKIFLLSVFLLGVGTQAQGRDKLFYHDVNLDAQGMLLPWYSTDPGVSYDHAIVLVWSFWNNMRADPNGLPYYMNHQVWRPDRDDARGLGGDQFAMALSSWQLLYAYSGDELVKQNMKFIADYYLSHSLSPGTSKWPNLPFPYNTLIYSGIYDGDMVIGKGFLQPDKAGSFGLELVHLYKMSSKDFYFQSTSGEYLQAAINIAHTLSQKMIVGDDQRSPLPFKVNAFTDEVGPLKDNNTSGTVIGLAEYTTNWSATMELFLALQTLDPTNAAEYDHGFKILLDWMKNYPLKTNKWGMFFEDVQGYSDTQINAVTFARFMMEHKQYFPNWQTEVSGIFDWVYKTLGNQNLSKYGVNIVNEQTVYSVPGESHIARQGSTELLFCSLSGDLTRKPGAIRQLNWATYTVDNDGKNIFPQDENWLTDGYGDYVRHYLRAMAIAPELAPANANHLISSTSVIQQSDYRGQFGKFLVPDFSGVDLSKVLLFYRSFDSQGVELVRMNQKPSQVLLQGKALNELSTGATTAEGFQWTPQSQGGGVLRVQRIDGAEVIILE